MKLTQKIAAGFIIARLHLLAKIAPTKAARQAFTFFCTPPTRSINVLSPLFLQAEKLQFDFQEYRIEGYRWNRGGQKRVLILHGFESTATNFESYVDPLIQKGYEVLAFDAPAHGRSSGRQMNALVYRDFVLHLHHQFGPIHAAIGHSFGGLALSLALAELPHDSSYRAVLIAPATETTTTIRLFLQQIRLTDTSVRTAFDALIKEISGQDASWFSVRRAMQNIHATILWLHDEDDRVTPLADALVVKNENHPLLNFVITTGLGHSRIYRDPQVGKTIVDFI